MSAEPVVMDAGLFQSPDVLHTLEAETSSEVWTRHPAQRWNPENFAREQIRSLVRRVFLSSASPQIRQVVFSSVETETDVRSICRRVGETLAAETLGRVAVMGEFPRLLQVADAQEFIDESAVRDNIPPLRRIATRVRGNLWLLPGAVRSDATTTASLHSYLGELRREFEYSIVQAPEVGESSETTAMARFADGIILVLSAQRTRRATAQKVKHVLEEAQARLLGTVLSDRAFPIPEGIYRRL